MGAAMAPAQHLAYLLRLGDASLVLGQRLAQWCGHGPVIEEDLALTNTALDLIGQARLIYTHAGALEGAGRDEDDFAFRRDVLDYFNPLLVEQPNGDFGVTMARQFLFDAWQLPLYEQLAGSADAGLAQIAAKAIPEVQYHLRHSAQWLVRLGDGTEESHARAQAALARLWPFTGELFSADAVDEAALAAGVGADLGSVHAAWSATVDKVLDEATLARPADGWMQAGGKQGEHSEHLGYILAELQFLPRAMPDAQNW